MKIVYYQIYQPVQLPFPSQVLCTILATFIRAKDKD